MRYFFLLFLFYQVIYAATYNIQSGWNLVGLGKSDKNISTDTFDENISTVWVYTKDGWNAFAYSDQVKEQLSSAKIPTLESIEGGQGFWINANNDTQISSEYKENVSNSKVLTSNYTTQTDVTDNTNKNYTYNYIKGSGAAVLEYIDWESASSLSNAQEIISSKVLEKAIPKVFFSSSKSHALIIDSYDCGGSDYTIAVTPYLSDGSIPGTSQNYWNKAVPLSFDIYVPSSQTSLGLSTYTTGQTYTQKEPVRDLSFDISLEDSFGKRVELQDAFNLCTINGSSYYNFELDDLSATYSLYNVSGLNKFKQIGNITFSTLTSGKTKSSAALQSLSPVIVTKDEAIKEFFVYDTDLNNITLAPFLLVRYPSLNDSVTYSVTNIDQSVLSNTQTITSDGMNIEKAYKINFNGIAEQNEFSAKLYFYFLNRDLVNYKLYEYNEGKYLPISADQSSIDDNSGKNVYHSGAYGIDSETTLVLAKPVNLDREIYLGKWNADLYSSGCLASGGVLELFIKNSVVLGTATAGSTLIGISGMPISGSDFSGYTADGTYWYGFITDSIISGNFNDYEGCSGSFSAQK